MKNIIIRTFIYFERSMQFCYKNKFLLNKYIHWNNKFMSKGLKRYPHLKGSFGLLQNLCCDRVNSQWRSHN